MKSFTLVLLCAVLAALAQSQMTFNLNGASYQIVSGYYSLQIPVNGGVPPLTYNFQAFPSTWLQSGNNINIPSAESITGGTWAIKVIVTDALGNRLRRSLVIKISNGGDPLIGDYSYDQTFTFTSEGQITSIPTSTAIVSSSSTSSTFSSSSFSSSSGSSGSSGSGSSGSAGSSGLGSAGSSGIGFGSASSTTGVVNLQASGTGISTSLPSNSELDTIINSGDIVTIRLTIQRVIASTLSCSAKSQYLSDFLGRIETFIAIKASQVTQLSNFVQNTKVQIASIRAQISNYTTAIQQLGIIGLQTELQTVLNSLQLAYNAYNVANIDLTPFNLNITANLQTISTLTSQRSNTAKQLEADNKSLNDTIALIASLEKQLNQARANRETLNARILQQTSAVSTFVRQIDFLNAQNVDLNNQINAINAKKATLMASYQAIESRAESIKSTINAYKAQENKYQAQIDTLNAQITQINGNLDLTPIVRLNGTISGLRNSIPSLKQQIDFVKFNCLGVVNYTVQTIDGTIRYIFGSSLFSTYVTEQYGLPNSNAFQAILGPISSVTLTPITIFNTDWSRTFGSAFQKDLELINPNITNTSNFFISDFSCSSNAGLSSSSGVVTRIAANVIYATLSDNSNVVLILGACSSVLVAKDTLPKIGQNIYWSGLKISSNTYQVYSALFV